MPLEQWFLKPEPKSPKPVTPSRLDRQIAIIRRVRRRLVHQRRALNELQIAYRDAQARSFELYTALFEAQEQLRRLERSRNHRHRSFFRRVIGCFL
jgi:hypothetical protein